MKKFSLLICILSLNLFSVSNETRIMEIKEALADTFYIDQQFYLYKELFTIQANEYQSEREDITPFVKSAKIALTNTSLRDSVLAGFSEEELAIFDTYQNLIDLAYNLNYNCCDVHFTYSYLIKDKNTYLGMEEHKGYFLQILDLERNLNCPILQDILLITEIVQIQDILKVFKIRNTLYFMNNLSKETIYYKDGVEFKEVAFYWNSLVPIAEEMLYKLDNEWSDIQYDKRKVLRLLFDKEYCLLIPCPDRNLNFIDRVLPYVVKYSNLDYVANRFSTVYVNHEEWEKKYAWIELHVKAYNFLKETNLEAAASYLKKAQELAKNTLNTPVFSSKKKEWEKAKAQALKLIESC